ncbi:MULTISPECIES: restriction endonuclease subunit S [unclassified Shewanella]|uniref:restriction endonuclease subunit S n=1 Tax=unclassified Shewanella TaxID=196818 RepID=UPI0021DA8E4A|nr:MULTISPECIES: restriction endonuclease subunit S [unclassified Shewanella]MCU8024315.1 restriction endonuclease subunit S [Shewanella sp. SM78]MCU8081277.1 restriction endonuclease subunit S [Shewanella sp. SM103]
MRHLRKVKIKDLGKVFTGSTPSTKDETMWDGEYPFVKPSDLINGSRRVFSTETKLSHKATKTSKGRLLPAGTTCIVTIGTIGKLCQLDRPAATNQQINSIVVDRTNYDEDYVYYLMSQSIDRVKVVEGGSASGREHVKKSTFEEIEIEVLPFSDQIKVSNLVARYDNLIENNNRRIAILEEMAQSLYREWFVNFRYPGHSNEPDGSSDNKDSKPNLIDSPLGPIPEGWEVGKLESASSMKYGKMSKKELRCEEGIPIYSGYKITGYYPEANLNESKVIVVARGVGGTGDVKMSPDICWLTNLSIYIMENENILKKAYLFYQLKFSNLRNLDSGTSISQITIADLSKYKIIIPPIQIQQSFEAICCTFWSQIKVLSKQSENLKKQRDMLLPKLISGQIQLKD